jgi:hypothetical protein
LIAPEWWLAARLAMEQEDAAVSENQPRVKDRVDIVAPSETEGSRFS